MGVMIREIINKTKNIGLRLLLLLLSEPRLNHMLLITQSEIKANVPTKTATIEARRIS